MGCCASSQSGGCASSQSDRDALFRDDVRRFREHNAWFLAEFPEIWTDKSWVLREHGPTWRFVLHRLAVGDQASWMQVHRLCFEAWKSERCERARATVFENMRIVAFNERGLVTEPGFDHRTHFNGEYAAIAAELGMFAPRDRCVETRTTEHLTSGGEAAGRVTDDPRTPRTTPPS